MCSGTPRPLPPVNSTVMCLQTVEVKTSILLSTALLSGSVKSSRGITYRKTWETTLSVVQLSPLRAQTPQMNPNLVCRPCSGSDSLEVLEALMHCENILNVLISVWICMDHNAKYEFWTCARCVSQKTNPIFAWDCITFIWYQHLRELYLKFKNEHTNISWWVPASHCDFLSCGWFLDAAGLISLHGNGGTTSGIPETRSTECEREVLFEYRLSGCTFFFIYFTVWWLSWYTFVIPFTNTLTEAPPSFYLPTLHSWGT